MPTPPLTTEQKQFALLYGRLAEQVGKRIVGKQNMLPVVRDALAVATHSDPESDVPEALVTLRLDLDTQRIEGRIMRPSKAMRGDEGIVVQRTHTPRGMSQLTTVNLSRLLAVEVVIVEPNTVQA